MSNKKKGNEDLTRIEDLSEFLHVEDSDLDSKFDNIIEEAVDLSNLTDEEFILPELPSDEEESPSSDEIENTEFSLESDAFQITESLDSSFTFEENQEDFSDNNFEDNPEDIFTNTFEEESPQEMSSDISEELSSNFSTNISEETNNELAQETVEDFLTISLNEAVEVTPVENNKDKTPEKFEEVRVFAQNFSYGKASLGGGNPPFSLIVKNLKYKEDADDILDLFEELGVVNESNLSEFKMSLNLGSLIVPQISEYTAIVLAHKLRKYDLDIIVGLSDEVHPPKSDDQNSRGLVKKENVRQNKKESFNLKATPFKIEDILVTTTPQIENYTINEYLGVETVFTIIEENELEKLQYVEKVARENLDLYEFSEAAEEFSSTTEKAFKDYQNSFNYLYQDLKNQLVQKAFIQGANALISLNYQLSPIQYERNYTIKNAYQILCSATLTKVTKD